MFLISIIPIARSVGTETLSYYIDDEPSLGSVIECPLKGGTVHGVVVSIRDIKSAKSEIRSASFRIKKIPKLSDVTSLYTEGYLKSAMECAEYYCVPLTEALTEVTPKSALVLGDAFLNTNIKKERDTTKYIEGDFESRMDYLLGTMAGSVGLVHIIAPTVTSVTHIYEYLNGKTEIVAITSKTTPKKLVSIMKDLRSKNIKTIVSTPQYLLYTQDSAHTIVLERASDHSYVTHIKSKIDLRRFTRSFTEYASIDLIESDVLVLPSSLAAQVDISRHNKIFPKIVDMTLERDKKMIWRSALLAKALDELSKSAGRAFLYVTRLGMYPSTVCADCSATLLSTCGAPLILRENSDKTREYYCNACDEVLKLDSEMHCGKCNSWRLNSVGIGIQTVAEDLRTLGHRVFQIDSQITKTPKQIEKTLEEFYNTAGAILVGTELALRHLTEKLDMVVAVSLDTILSTNSYKSDIEAMYVIDRLSEVSKRYFLLQTRKPKTPVLSIRNNIEHAEFKRRYLNDAKDLSYPPFGVLVTIDSILKPNAKDTSLIKNMLSIGDISWQLFNGVYRLEYKTSNNQWLSDQNLRYRLSILPHYFKINIE